jgi:VWFA-related protein
VPGETDDTAAVAARQPGTRVFAFFLDELHVSAPNADLVRRTVTSFIEEKLHARDLVAVMKPFDAARSVRFTRDRAFAHGVIASFEGRKENGRPRTAYEAQVLDRAAAAGGGRAQIVKTGLRELAMRLGDLHAERPILIIFSEGFRAEADAIRTPLPDLGGLLRAASRFHITTFTFNPAFVTPDAGAVQEQAANRQMLSWLAAETGGHAVGADRFIHGVARLFHDTEAYYAITYESPEPDGRYHELNVRVKRTGASALTHRGRWAIRESDWREIVALPDSARPASDRPLRRSPLVDVWVGVRRDSARGARIVITWEPRRALDGSPQVAVKARAADGERLIELQVAPLGGGTASTPDFAAFAASSGRVDLDLTIRDSQGTVLDTDVRYIDVPEFRSSAAEVPLLLPVWIVNAATPRALQRGTADIEVAPVAARTFHRSQHLLVRVPVFDPGGEGARVTAALLNQRGLEMRGLDPLGPSHDDVTDFALPLVGLAPGEYQLELRAVNRRGAASERMRFRLVG